MRRLFVLFAFSIAGASGCTGCGASPLERNAGGVRITLPESPLRFYLTSAGFRSERTIHLENTAFSSRTVRFQTQAPFDAPGETVLAAGAGSDVTLGFSPAAAGTFEGTLQIDVVSDSASIDLLGQGREDSECATSRQCEVAVKDPSTGACDRSYAPDGTGCEAACIDDGACQAGVCVGAPARCDDGDACTTDTCDLSTGCEHRAIHCASSTDPCHVPVCDPATGCGFANAADGTICGRRTCTIQDVCIGGACVERVPSDGDACGNDSPCQPLGVCQSSVCQLPPATTLTPAWTYHVAQWQYGRFTGLVDDDGNFVLARRESDFPPKAWIDSIAPNGTVSLQLPVAVREYATARWNLEEPIAPLGDRLFSRCPTGAEQRMELCSRDRVTGKDQWMTDLQTALAPSFPTGTDHAFYVWPRWVYPSPQSDRIDVEVDIQWWDRQLDSVYVQGEAVATVELSSGKVLRTWSLPDHQAVGPRDADGNFYGSDWGIGPALVSWDPNGAPRWSVPVVDRAGGISLLWKDAAFDVLQPTAPGQCWQSMRPVIRDLATGMIRGSPDWWLGGGIAAAGDRFYTSGWKGTGSLDQCPSPGPQSLITLDRSTGDVDLVVPFGHTGKKWTQLGPFTPTAQGTIMFIATADESGVPVHYLGEWDLDFNERFLCQLEVTSPSKDAYSFALSNGYVVLLFPGEVDSVEGYAVPGREPRR